MSYGIYEVVFYSSWKVELRIDDAKFIRAREGGEKAQNSIIQQFKRKCQKVYDRQPEQRIYWEDRSFDIKRVSDSAVPRKKRKSSQLSVDKRLNAPSVTSPPEPWISTEPTCPCPDNCVQCDIGNHWTCRNCPRTR